MSDSRPVSLPPDAPVVLVIRDGWGRNPHSEHDAFNAVKLAATPVADRLEAPLLDVAGGGAANGSFSGSQVLASGTLSASFRSQRAGYGLALRELQARCRRYESHVPKLVQLQQQQRDAKNRILALRAREKAARAGGAK